MANDAIIAPNDRELQLLPAVEEIGNISQRLYRLLTNILEQPDDVKHVHSLVENLSQKIALLKVNIKDYKIDTTILEDRYDRPIATPIPVDDGRERIYWGPEEARKLKDEIVAEVVEVIKNQTVPKRRKSNSKLAAQTIVNAKKKRPAGRGRSKKQFDFDDTPK